MGSLRAVISQGVDAAYKALGDVPVSMNMKHFTGSPTRDMETGLYSQPFTRYTPKVIITDIKILKNMANVIEGDRAGVIRSKEVPVVGIKDIIFDASQAFEVLHVYPDPTKTVYILDMRTVTEKVGLADLLPEGDEEVFAGRIFKFPTPLLVWPINHGYGFWPSIEMFDLDGIEIGGTVDNSDLNNLTVTFLVPKAGQARVF